MNTLLSCCLTPVQAQEEDVIEHLGNKYVIHVDQLKPDTEMTLLDVLHICPELMASDGKTLTADYLLSVDDIMLSVDYEPLLESIKACELSEVVVCTYGAVNNATDGVQGSIDLAFKEGMGTIDEVLTAQTAWLKANSEKIDAEIDVQLTYEYLTKVMGTMNY